MSDSRPASSVTKGPEHEVEPPRVIGGLGAFSLVAGSMIGVGVFIFLDEIARGTGSVPMFFGMLLLGGFFAVCGAAACGELGAMMPRAGGDYVFQRAAYGRSIAFASGWVLFAAIFAGSNAALSVAVFQYELGPLFGVDMNAAVLGPITGAQLGAIGLLVLLAGLNDLGASMSSRAQTILTLTPILAMALLAVAIIIIQPTPAAPLTGDELGQIPATLSLAGLATGFLAVNFIFSGWINIIYVAAEVKDPGRNVPRSMFSATAVVTLLYILVATAFLIVLGFDGVASSGSPALGFDAGTRTANALGVSWAAPVVLIVITFAIVTSVNATVMAGARVGYAMAKDGAFWRPVGVLSGKRQVPRRSLWLQTFISCLIVLTGTAEAIAEMTSLAMFVTGSLTVAAVYVLRKKMPEAPRPYKATGYPVLPAIYILLAVLAILAKVDDARAKEGLGAWYPLIGVGILGVTWVGHLLYLRYWKSAAVVAVGFIASGIAFDSMTGPTPQARALTPVVPAMIVSEPLPATLDARGLVTAP
ncbi:MAG: amino acid permease [Deltaproteobacteria bacterium]|nr:amino acid permease [Deltaproteobacteria bacterium]